MQRTLKQPFLAVLLAAFLVSSISACGGDGKDAAATAKKAAAPAKDEKDGKSGSTKARRKPSSDRKPGADTLTTTKQAPDRGGETSSPKAGAATPTTDVPNPAAQAVPPQAGAASVQAGAAVPAPQTARPPDTPAARADISRPPLADPRLLLTMVDVSKIAPAKARFRRAALAGMPRTEDGDSIMYAPEKGDSFGFSLQLFRTRNAQETKKRYEALQASYPNSQEISAVSGKTFFSYWDEVMHIAFVHPGKNMVVVVSCGRAFCDSNQLMELSGTISDRLK